MMNSSFEDSDYQGAPKTWKMLSDELNILMVMVMLLY